MNVLIVGSGATEYTLAKKFSQNSKTKNIFVTSNLEAMKEFSTFIDLSESNPQEILDFVNSNDIDLTITFSETAISKGIAELFKEAGKDIFAPTAASARFVLSKASGKKFMYKTKIQTPKFGIFDKESFAIDYAKKSAYPLVIKLDGYIEGECARVCENFAQAKTVIEDVFLNFNKKITLENLIKGKEVSFYVLTDGYNAIPLTSVTPYKYSLEGDGGLVTRGLGAYAPSFAVSEEIEKLIAQKVVFPVIDELNRNKTPYVGILGVDLIIDKDNRIWTIEFNAALPSPDAQCLFELLDEDLYLLIKSTLAGSLADDYQEIKMKNGYCVSVVLASGNYPVSSKSGEVIEGLGDLDCDIEVAHFNTAKNEAGEYITTGKRTLVLTKAASTLSIAKEILYENIGLVRFKGMRYRNDIAKTAPNAF